MINNNRKVGGKIIKSEKVNKPKKHALVFFLLFYTAFTILLLITVLSHIILDM